MWAMEVVGVICQLGKEGGGVGGIAEKEKRNKTKALSLDRKNMSGSNMNDQRLSMG